MPTGAITVRSREKLRVKNRRFNLHTSCRYMIFAAMYSNIQPFVKLKSAMSKRRKKRVYLPYLQLLKDSKMLSKKSAAVACFNEIVKVADDFLYYLSVMKLANRWKMSKLFRQR